MLAAYTGSKLTNLTTVALSDDAPSASGTSQVVFNAVAGLTYYFAVDGFASSVGDVQLNLSGATPDPIRFASIARLFDGRLSLSLSGTPTELCMLETSTNRIDWQTILTNQFSGATYEFLQPVNSNVPMRFYRARSWP